MNAIAASRRSTRGALPPFDGQGDMVLFSWHKCLSGTCLSIMLGRCKVSFDRYLRPLSITLPPPGERQAMTQDPIRHYVVLKISGATRKEVIERYCDKDRDSAGAWAAGYI